MPSFTALVTYHVDDERVTDLITTALEGGSNYWYWCDLERSVRNGAEFIVDEPMKGGKLCIKLIEPDELDTPIKGERGPGGVQEWWLTRDTAIDGLKLMATKYPKHFADWINENDDAITGDVFLQCALFGEIVFG